MINTSTTQNNDFNITDFLQKSGWHDEQVYIDRTELNNRIVAVTKKFFPKVTMETFTLRNDYRVSIIDIKTKEKIPAHTSKEDYLKIKGFIDHNLKKNSDDRFLALSYENFQRDISENIEKNISDLDIEKILLDLAYSRAQNNFSAKYPASFVDLTV